MTPEQQKAKEIVKKHYLIIEDATAGLFEEDVEYVKARQTAAKACAIEEVKAVLQIYKHDYNFNYWRSVFFLKVLNEIEKL